jgi:hypothetical protein
MEAPPPAPEETSGSGTESPFPELSTKESAASDVGSAAASQEAPAAEVHDAAAEAVPAEAASAAEAEAASAAAEPSPAEAEAAAAVSEVAAEAAAEVEAATEAAASAASPSSGRERRVSMTEPEGGKKGTPRKLRKDEEKEGVGHAAVKSAGESDWGTRCASSTEWWAYLCPDPLPHPPPPPLLSSPLLPSPLTTTLNFALLCVSPPPACRGPAP